MSRPTLPEDAKALPMVRFTVLANGYAAAPILARLSPQPQRYVIPASYQRYWNNAAYRPELELREVKWATDQLLIGQACLWSPDNSLLGDLSPWSCLAGDSNWPQAPGGLLHWTRTVPGDSSFPADYDQKPLDRGDVFYFSLITELWPIVNPSHYGVAP